MTKSLLIAVSVSFCMFLSSCSHNAGIVGVGTGWRVGSAEASVQYVDGLFLTTVNRDNIEFEAELDSSAGVTLDPKTNTYKGVKSIKYVVGPQLGGYSEKLGEQSPDALKSYFDAVAAYYSAKAKRQEEKLASNQAQSNEKESTTDKAKESK